MAPRGAAQGSPQAEQGKAPPGFFLHCSARGGTEPSVAQPQKDPPMCPGSHRPSTRRGKDGTGEGTPEQRPALGASGGGADRMQWAAGGRHRGVCGSGFVLPHRAALGRRSASFQRPEKAACPHQIFRLRVHHPERGKVHLGAVLRPTLIGAAAVLLLQGRGKSCSE